MKLKIGSYYKDGNGNTHGPLTSNMMRGRYVYRCGDQTWTSAGKYDINNPGSSKRNLIGEVPVPATRLASVRTHPDLAKLQEALDGEQKDVAEAGLKLLLLLLANKCT